MARSIQSVERATAILRILSSAGRPLRLAEIAGALGLAKPTTFGIIRTLRDVGFVQQDKTTSDYSLGDGVRHLERATFDPHDLRSHAMNWSDALASRTRLEVLIAVPQSDGARIIHHVFRPDDSEQSLRLDEVLPFHATALGKVALAFGAGIASPSPDLERYTQRTLTRRVTFDAEMVRVLERGWASERAEFMPGIGAVSVGSVPSTKTSGSGQNVTIVPVLVVAFPLVSLEVAFPRANDCVHVKPSRITWTVSLDDSAFTTETPTP